MANRDEWVAKQCAAFPDARADVLRFIYDFNARSSDLYEVFASGYCYYFANMIQDAFNGGEVCWSVGRGHIVWVDDNGVAYDIGGVCYDYDKLVSVEYMGNLIVDFKHNGWEYKPDNDKINKWCSKNGVPAIRAVAKLWECIPISRLNFNGLLEQDVIANWDKYVDQLIPHDGSVYLVDNLVERLPASIRRCYASNKECVLANMDSLFD